MCNDFIIWQQHGARKFSLFPFVNVWPTHVLLLWAKVVPKKHMPAFDDSLILCHLSERTAEKKKKKSPSLFGVSQGWWRGDRGMGGRLQGCRLKHALNTEEPNRRRREETSRTWRDLWSDTQDVFEAVLSSRGKDGSVLYCVFGFGLQYTTYTLTYAALNPWDKLNYRR